MFSLLTTLASLIGRTSRALNLGSGATWPGEIILRFYPDALKRLTSHVHRAIVFVAGTNGKTTTAKMIEAVISSPPVVHNRTGANLLNGLVSAFLDQADPDYAIFEVDENTLPAALDQVGNCPPTVAIIVVVLNLFRDQLDRYGEVDTIAKKWQKALNEFPRSASLILNTDDPQIATLGDNPLLTKYYFGLAEKTGLVSKQHASDSDYCPRCYHELSYHQFYLSHLGVWFCPGCSLVRPRPTLSTWSWPLPGRYNRYNTLAAVLTGLTLGLDRAEISPRLARFTPAFGRQEEVTRAGRKIQILLSKNPAGFNASLELVNELKAETLLLALNDNIPDGRDVSWIWDVDFEVLNPKIKLFIGGTRAYDLALRIKYALYDGKNDRRLPVFTNLKMAIDQAIQATSPGDTLYILPTYSAMLEARRILTGKKI